MANHEAGVALFVTAGTAGADILSFLAAPSSSTVNVAGRRASVALGIENLVPNFVLAHFNYRCDTHCRLGPLRERCLLIRDAGLTVGIVLRHETTIKWPPDGDHFYCIREARRTVPSDPGKTNVLLIAIV